MEERKPEKYANVQLVALVVAMGNEGEGVLRRTPGVLPYALGRMGAPMNGALQTTVIARKRGVWF